MILVDPRVLESTSRPPVSDATAHSLREMDQQMRDALENPEANLEDKANMYHQILQKYLKRFDQFKEKPLGTITVGNTTPTPHKTSEVQRSETTVADAASPLLENVEKDVIQSVPKTMKNKAERLLQRIQNHPDLTWNPRGEIVWQGQVIKNSNLVDLVNDVLRKRQSVQPAGWETFATALKEVNIPQDLVGNPERWRFMRTQIPDAPSYTAQSTEDLDKDASASHFHRTLSTPQALTPPPSLRNTPLSSRSSSSRKRQETTSFVRRKRKLQLSPLTRWEGF